MRIFECTVCQEQIQSNTIPKKCSNPCCTNTEFQLKMIGCEFCGENDKDLLIIHHIIPRGLLGSDELENKIILCANCHRKLHSELKKLIYNYTVEKVKSYSAIYNG